jgi:hypothetical protein
VANVTYKHLEGKTVVGLFSLGQWVQLVAGVVLGLLFGIYLSPLPPTATIFFSCLLPGLPLAASYGAMGLEFSLSQGARAAWRFWRRPRAYLPGPGQSAAGYLVHPAADPRRPAATAGSDALGSRDLEALWDG